MGFRDVDPFYIPPSIIPKGMVYQWCAKYVFGESNPQYRTMLEAGWTPVPIKRHPGVLFSSNDGDGNIYYGGQMLMCRRIEFTQEAHDLNADTAYRNAGTRQRIVTHPIGYIGLDTVQMGAARIAGISCAEYVRRRVNAIAEGRDLETVIAGDIDRDYPGINPRLIFKTIPRPRHPWVRWLFNLVSTQRAEP